MKGRPIRAPRGGRRVWRRKRRYTRATRASRHNISWLLLQLHVHHLQPCLHLRLLLLHDLALLLPLLTLLLQVLLILHMLLEHIMITISSELLIVPDLL